MMTISKSTNKRDYNDKGTYDNLWEGTACARTAVLAKSMLSSLRGRKKSPSIYAYVTIDDGSSE